MRTRLALLSLAALLALAAGAVPALATPGPAAARASADDHGSGGSGSDEQPATTASARLPSTERPRSKPRLPGSVSGRQSSGTVSHESGLSPSSARLAT